MSNLALDDAARGALWLRKGRERLESLSAADRSRLEESGRTWMVAPDGSIPQEETQGADEDHAPAPIGWGTYGWKYDPRLVEAALEMGVGIIDTAEGYGFGRVEKQLGLALATSGETPGCRTWVASKAARNHMSRAAVISAGRRSRDNLRVRAIQLYQIHWPVLPMEPAFDGLAQLLEEGTILRAGVCNFSAGLLNAAVGLARERGFRVWSNQVRLNRADPGAADYLIPFCHRLGVRTIAYSPLGQGAERKDPAASLKWVLGRADVAIPATNDPAHLRANCRAGGLPAE